MKVCPFEAITLENNLAYIDPNKCKSCRKCEEACPQNTIIALNFPPRKPKVEAPAGEAATKPAAAKVEAPKVETPKVEVPKAEAPKAPEAPKAEAQPKEEPFTEEQKEVIRKDIKAFLDSMFGAMSMEVKADITFDDEENSVNVDLSGDNMGVLIGKRGQTLDSIQYLTSLVINKNSEKYVRVKLDTENYRKRRKETLESLAKNIAYKVKRSRRPVSLEPMNPYERRIIHSALQADKFVSTRSEGEEPFRHVVVYLDREKSGNNRYSRKNYNDLSLIHI